MTPRCARASRVRSRARCTQSHTTWVGALRLCCFRNRILRPVYLGASPSSPGGLDDAPFLLSTMAWYVCTMVPIMACSLATTLPSSCSPTSSRSIFSANFSQSLAVIISVSTALSRSDLAYRLRARASFLTISAAEHSIDACHS